MQDTAALTLSIPTHLLTSEENWAFNVRIYYKKTGRFYLY